MQRMTNGVTIEADGPDHDLGTVLHRVCQELRDVAAAIERVEPHLSGPAVLLPEAGDAERTRALQEIDLALQTVRGLSDFVGSLARALPADCLVETATALNVVTLSDMRQRLARGGAEAARDAAPARAVGDIELF